MLANFRHLGWGLALLTFLVSRANSAEPQNSPTVPRAASVPASWRDDAELHAVTFVGRGAGFAVGDHGTVLKTADGGRTWTFLAAPTTASLRSVCFLTDRVGWVAGIVSDPYTRLSTGVVLKTRDGGANWEAVAAPTLPAVHHLQFFDLTTGVAVGEGSEDFPTGVMTTGDGGATWQPAPGPESRGWRVASFLQPDVGAIAGQRGRLSLVGGGRLLSPRVEDLGMRGLRGLALLKDNTGWLVGDGALVQRTENGGVSWMEPAKPLPEELRDFMDFRCVEARGPRAWIAGQPGSVIWHTRDFGASWERSPTGNPAPWNAVRFSSDDEGVAVGAFGAIARTENGGKTWDLVRGPGRRAALMSVVAWPGRVPFEMLARHAGDQGYRSVVLAPARGDLGPDGLAQHDLDVRLHDAVTRLGGGRGTIGWRFPLVFPGMEKNADRLLADWNRRTEGRLAQVFLGSLTAEIRAWRPSVILLDVASRDDAATNLLNDVVLRAVKQAGDATCHLAHQDLAALEPWQVDRVFVRLGEGSSGAPMVDAFEWLPHQRKTIREAAAPARRLVDPERRSSEARQTFRLLWNSGAESSETSPRDFFTGLAIAAGSDARRSLTASNDEDERERAFATRQRNFHAYVERYADDPRQGAQLIAQLRGVSRGMRDEQAASQLAELAEQYRARGRWDLVEATFVELVENYPAEPAAAEALVWLFHRWAGAEPTWQRSRGTQAEMKRLQSDVDRVSERVMRAMERMQIDPAQRGPDEPDDSPDPLEFEARGGQPQVGPEQSWQSAAMRLWSEKAVRVASLIRARDPILYRQAEIQFPLAALMRRRGVDRFADGIYRRQQSAPETNSWRQTADAELWMVQPIDQPIKPIYPCRRIATPPHLDGTLSDPCWEEAKEMRLAATAREYEPGDDYPLVMFAYDREYLYVAASVPRHPDAPADRPIKSGRNHDADLSRHDRLTLYLDVDRDYATYYAFHVDQRGLTAESCWDDHFWNPRWHVAVDADEARWRIEVAIPFAELGPEPPEANQIWALGVARTIPAIGVESWTQPATSRPRPESFGLLKFSTAR